MRLYRDRWLLRLVGALFGLGLFLLGLFSLFGGGEQLTAATALLARGFGITLVVVGSLAMIGSWAARNVDWLWYRKPNRWRMIQGRPTGWRRWWYD